MAHLVIPSEANAGLYAILGRPPRVGFDMSSYPSLIAHKARIGERDAVREVRRIEGTLPDAVPPA